MGDDREYVLGTHDEEIARLALQHRVWRPRATAAWRRAGFTVGQTILDVGCGPGYAALDLAEIVGESGRVIALDKSRRFLDFLEAARIHRGLQNITAHEIDLDEEALPAIEADGAWSRWVFAFVRDPRALLTRVCDRLKRGGVLVAHEYFDYATWRLSPRCAELEEFVEITMESWRANGGEPDVGLAMPVWLEELGFDVRTLRPIVEIIPASSFVWQWPKAYIQNGLIRLVGLGYLTKERAMEMAKEITAREAAPHTHMITPAVAEIIAVKR
jgi:SAM-dependent methyltransferase